MHDLLQTDGPHPPDYWDEQVETAVRQSSLCRDPADFEFTGTEITELARHLREARARNGPVEGCREPEHLIGLLESTLGNDPWSDCKDAEVGFALENLTMQNHSFSGALSVLAGTNPPPPGTTFTDALDVVADYLDHLHRATPENWRTLLVRG